ncbi:hypothetical protein [Parapedobacter koreensis]|uniref:Glycosyl hydrolase family 67 N-terminus n=1 Tax=Parapedobacter koreensis TaxID=332977 RepID=A0A1H7IUR8_9SPHI|nr:hypothetical protein [Parapedobacter koreensis]SEK66231.1 hypothetical protein SAMN05421740_102372 [Parapedobacter koreensis]
MKIPNCLRTLLLVFPLLLSHARAVSADPDISIITDAQLSPVASHGLTKLIGILERKQLTFETLTSTDAAKGRIILVTGIAHGDGLAASLLKAGNHAVPKMKEALTIWNTSWQNKPATVVSGYDDTGLMYGLLDVANRISWSTDPSDPLHFVKEVTSSPDIKERGIAMYTMNRAYWESRFYDENFWAQYFDMMAQNRLNMLEILFGYENGGFMAPCYPYFFNVDQYPDVKMADITTEQQQRNVTTMHQVIKMAHDRGIAIRLGIWDHVYRGGVQAGGNPDFEYREGHPLPWQVTGLDSTNLNLYTKAAFAKFLKTFPELDAILFKTNNESGLKESELHAFSLNFFETVKETAPDMFIDIHAKGLTDALIKSATDMGIKFRIAPKFWMEQMGLPFSPTHINREDQKNRRHGYADLLRYPQHYQMLWKLWNGGSTRVFLWGDPEYVRRFAASSHLYNSDAYSVYEPMATKMESQMHDAVPFQLLNPSYSYYEYEFERYWNFYQTFGLIGYDPNTPDEVWDKEFEKRFGEKAGPLIRSALNEASWVLPRIVGACYPYSFFPTTSAWPEKQRLGDLPLYAKAEGSDLQQFASFDEEARVLLGELETAKTLPSTTSMWLAQLAADINQKVAEAETFIGSQDNKEFNSTVTDLRMLANLALYHSRRIPAAISYCLFLHTQDASALDEAINHEANAIEAWSQLVNAAGDVYADPILIGKKPLSGHWKDELVLLNGGLEKLQAERSAFKPNGPATTSPSYKPTDDPENSKYFAISHRAPDTAAVGLPITIQVRVHAPAGLKWVHLQYRAMNQYKDFEMLPMSATGEKDLFQAIIPADQVDPQYDLMYLIEMMDMNGKGFIYPDLNKETPYKIIHFR